MVNYNDVARMATSGINFFRGGNGEFNCVANFSGASMVDGVEIHEPKQEFKIRGFVRSPKTREVDGESIMATDKLGVFDNSQKLEKGYTVTIDGQKYVIIEPRPIRQTNVTVAYRPIMRRISVHG